MAIKVSKAVLQDIGHTVDLDDLMEDGNRYFKGATNRPFPAWRADSPTELGKFVVELGIRAGDQDCEDMTEQMGHDIVERLMVEDLGTGIVFGFPGVELT